MVGCDEATAGPQGRAVASQQLHDQILADALAAERQNVDGSTDRPHHVVVEKVGEGRHVAD